MNTSAKSARSEHQQDWAAGSRPLGEARLTAMLAARVMGWGVAPDRFLTGVRCWLPRWRFQPATCLEDAFRLLEHAASEEYAMGSSENGGFWVKVRIGDAIGEALDVSKPRAITFAIARAIGLEVDAS